MKILSLLFTVLMTTVSYAGDIVLEAERIHYLNPGWDLVAKDLIVKDEKPYIRIETRGNCHYEYEQQCSTDQQGNTHCTTVPKWVCDSDAALFTLPASVVVTGTEVRYQAEDKDLKIGTKKNFLFWKWVKLEANIGIWTDLLKAKLIIREAKSVEQEVNFQKLHEIEKK